MEQQYITQTVKDFFQKLDDIHDKLEHFSGKIDNKRDTTFNLLNSFRDNSNKLKNEFIPKESKLNPVEEKLKETMNDIQNSIADWYCQIEKNKKGVRFMRTHEKYLVVMVFGAVKAGKSTLGNFFAGKDFVNAKFDNEYKHREHPIFEMEEKGRNTGDIELDKNGQYWFSEGVTDTTGAIQYFTLSGLRWMDSPGTGALEKEEDTRNMEEMVNEYIPYTDMCIFLMNSSEPGLMEDMKYIRKLSREEQEAIIVITKSDKIEENIDEKGNFIDKWMPKSAEIRKRQENDICERLQKKYPDIRADKFRAISVSTYLANLAIENEDVDLYKDSNLDKLMAILGDKISENVIELKEKKPKQNLNNFIDNIINGEETFKGIEKLNQALKEILLPIKNYKNDIQMRKENIKKTTCSKIKNEVRKISHQWEAEVEKNGQNLNDGFLSKKIMKIANPILEKEINNSISKVIENYSNQQIEKMNKMFNVGGINKQYKKAEQKYTKIYYELRAPEGVWEHIRDFFGKKYYERREEEITTTYQVDLGTNILDYLEKLMPELESLVEEEVDKALKNLLETYFAPQEKYVEKMQLQLKQLKSDLLELKFK